MCFFPIHYINSFIILLIVYFYYTVWMLEILAPIRSFFFFSFYSRESYFCLSNCIELCVQVSMFREHSQIGLLLCLAPQIEEHEAETGSLGRC